MKGVASFLVIPLLFLLSAVLLPSDSYGRGAVVNVTGAEFREAGTLGESEVLDRSGSKVPFRSFLGQKPLLVVFWASWCIECRAEVPTLNRLALDPEIRVLAINLGESEKKVQTFISSFHVGYPVVRDPGWQTSAAYRVLGIPVCLLLDREGRILYRGSSVPGNIAVYLR